VAKDIEYESLLNRYNLQITQIKEMQEQYDSKESAWQAFEAECKVIDKNTRKLCEKILAKDRNQMGLGHSKTWSSFSTKEMVESAEESFKEYVKQNTELIQHIMKIAEDRGRQLDDLKDQIAQMMTHGNINHINADEMITNAEKAAEDQRIKEKTSNATKKAAQEGSIELIVMDESDVEDADIKGLMELKEKAEKIKLTPKSIPVTPSEAKLQQNKQIEKNVSQAHVVDIKAYVDKCGDYEWQVLDAIGTQGLSRYKEIEEWITQQTSSLKSPVRTALMGLNRSGLIDGVQCALPLSSSSKLYSLTELGHRIYKYHFNKQAVVSEVERVTAEHDNPEHGYGIMDIEKILKKSGRYSSISSFNRDKAIKVKIGGQDLLFIPDLICVNKRGYTEYFEYERGLHNQVNFNMKCNKMCKVTKFLNFIAPNKNVLKILKGKVDGWIQSKDAQSLKGYIVRIGTACTIRDNSEWPVEYNLSKSLEAIRSSV